MTGSGHRRKYEFVDKLAFYTIGVLVTALMGVQVKQMNEFNEKSAFNYKHSISADVKLETIIDNQRQFKVEVKEVQNKMDSLDKKATAICNTQKQYWPTHGEDCK